MTTNTEHIVAVYPGSFDPVTHGHLDVIRRAAKLFNELIIGIGRNPGKDMMFTPQERLDMLEPLLAEWPHVQAEAYDGLTFDFVQQCNARVIVRGIRDTTDLSNELLQANLNRHEPSASVGEPPAASPAQSGKVIPCVPDPS